jgi:hypothetical protein
MSRPVGTELGSEDPYALLGLRRDASTADIAAARRPALLRNHPDRGGTHDRAAKINAAAALLGDPDRRRDYDQQTPASGPRGQAGEPTGRPAPGPPPGSRPGAGPPSEPAGRPAPGPPPGSRPGTGPPGAGWVPPAWRPPRPPPRASDAVHPSAGDRPLTSPSPHPVHWRPDGMDNPYASPHTGVPPPRRPAHAPRRKRRLRYLLPTVAAVILTGGALGEVNHDRTSAAARAVDHLGTPKTPFWTAIVDSEPERSAGHPEANAVVAALKKQGYKTLPVFRSAAYPSLKPGYWVVATGRFPTATQAAAAATRLRARGFSKASPRCVGTTAACSGHA